MLLNKYQPLELLDYECYLILPAALHYRRGIPVSWFCSVEMGCLTLPEMSQSLNDRVWIWAQDLEPGFDSKAQSMSISYLSFKKLLAMSTPPQATSSSSLDHNVSELYMQWHRAQRLHSKLCCGLLLLMELSVTEFHSGKTGNKLHKHGTEGPRGVQLFFTSDVICQMKSFSGG